MLHLLQNNNYIDQIEKAIDECFENIDNSSQLKESCIYAIKGDAKRLRPLLVLLVAEQVNNQYDVMQAALSVEFFHTASLIADDLPCIDDETYRRNKLATHKVFGEDVALLASYSFIALGYELICKNAEKMKEINNDINYCNKVCTTAIRIASSVAGLEGATSGQYYDLKTNSPSLEMIYKVMHQKTAVLFELSFIFGWLFSGGSLDKVDEIRKAAFHFGNAFQISDDIDDILEDKKDSLNIASFLGKEKAKELFVEEMNKSKAALKELKLLSLPIKKIIQKIEEKII